jgi:enoyl-CoA hydratase/carnithine racemase
MNCKYLKVRIENRVGWIEYNRPPINSFNWDKLREVPTALESLLNDQQVRVIVFASALEKYFSTGADLKGTLVSAEEALAMGLVDLIYPPERLHAEVQTYAESLAQKPAKALAAIRHTITEGGAVSFEEGLKLEYATAVKLSGSKDFSEGIRAFLEKRKPNWE